MSNETGDNAQNPESPQATPAQEASSAQATTGPTRIEIPEGMSREELKSLYDGAVEVIKEHSILKGRITQIGRDVVVVDISYKSEGIIPTEEFGSSLDEYKVGDEIKVYLEKKEDSDGLVALSKTKADRQLRWEETMQRCKEGEKVTGRIVRKVRGG